MPDKNRSSTHRLSTRLIVAFIAAIVVTTFVAGVPAYWFIRTELERQVWERVADGQRATLALLEAQKDRLVNLASHAAQRPTLQRLAGEDDPAALSDYLQTFKAGVGLDILIVRDSKGGFVAGDVNAFYPTAPPYPQEAVFYTFSNPEPELALLATSPIPGGQPDMSFVTVGMILDNEFVKQLATETGFEQSILIGGKRVSSSLTGFLPEAASASVQRVTSSGLAENIELPVGRTRYYTTLFPLLDDHNKSIALIEVALPVNELVAANRRALLTLIFSTILVALTGSALAVIYARRLTDPLSQLTEAAQNTSLGDFATPIPYFADPYEIATLSAAFEESRANIQRYLDNLAQAKAWSETLIQSIVEGIVTVDAQGAITSFSQGAERLLGWGSDEVLNKPVNQIFLMGDGGQFVDHLPQAGGMHPIKVITRNGREITLAVTSARLKPSNGGPSQLALVLRDITEEEAAQRLGSYFLANISHEFRTPLSALNASVELLLEEIEDLSLAEIAELLNSVHLSVTSLQTLIDNLLESTSIEAGHFRIHRRLTDINDVISEAVRLIKPLLDRRQQSLALYEPPELPLANIDPTRLTQVLVNLLSNASKYSPMEDTIELSVERISHDALRLSVTDGGPGISPHDRANLFRRFVRLGDRDETQYGVGLGLWVVKTIVEEHGGEVGVDNRPSGGAVFWFTLPLDGGEA
jgi:PAS domain S-box-containing protein